MCALNLRGMDRRTMVKRPGGREMEGRPQGDLPVTRTEPEVHGEQSQGGSSPQQKDTRWVIERIQETFDVRAP